MKVGLKPLASESEAYKNVINLFNSTVKRDTTKSGIGAMRPPVGDAETIPAAPTYKT